MFGTAERRRKARRGEAREKGREDALCGRPARRLFTGDEERCGYLDGYTEGARIVEFIRSERPVANLPEAVTHRS